MAIHRWARISGSDPAIFYETDTLTFAELSRRVRETGAVLAVGGVRSGIRPRAATLAVALLFHIGGLIAFTLGTITRRGAVVIRRTFDPRGCLQDVARYRIASTFMAPGAPVPPALITEYAAHGVALQQAWGLTETAPFATCLPPHLVRESPASAGFAMPYSEVRVVAPDSGQPVTDTLTNASGKIDRAAVRVLVSGASSAGDQHEDSQG
jgi:acyl-CoA synthetase (AMP-forming)/AMP-acid ligase II